MRGWKLATVILGVGLLALAVFTLSMALSAQASSRSGSWPDGMMGGSGDGMMGGYGQMGRQGMMRYGFGRTRNIPPLTPEKAQAAAQSYLDGLGNADLEIREVMVFTNHAYVQFGEKSTGAGAFEALVDPATEALAPEPGPNMMWNLKYGPMTTGAMPGMGMMMGGGMMGGYGMMPIAGGQALSLRSPGDMPVSSAEAITTAQKYLDSYLPGLQADAEAAAFYGYYTIDTLRDGKPVGMLSVNGFTRQVFVHFWHGDFISETGEE